MPSLTLVVLIFLVAMLYASVGHGGASGYLAAMSLVGGYAPAAMSSSALLLNLIVAGTAWMTFWRAGYGSWSLLWPFVVSSVPAALIGGWLLISAQTYRWLLAICLLVAAARLCLPAGQAGLPLLRNNNERTESPPLAAALPVGGAIGFISGIVGVGGGIFLSPLMVLLRWADVKRAAAISAAFIMVNSLAGLAGRMVAGRLMMGSLALFVIAALAGGIVGSRLGANHVSGVWLRRLLAAVLVVAAGKLVARYGPTTYAGLPTASPAVERIESLMEDGGHGDPLGGPSGAAVRRRRWDG